MDYSEQLESSCFHSLMQVYFLPTTHTLGAEEGGNWEMLVGRVFKSPNKSLFSPSQDPGKGKHSKVEKF